MPQGKSRRVAKHTGNRENCYAQSCRPHRGHGQQVQGQVLRDWEMNQRQAEDECWKVEKQRLVALLCLKENEELVGWSPGRRRSCFIGKRVRVSWRLLNLR